MAYPLCEIKFLGEEKANVRTLMKMIKINKMLKVNTIFYAYSTLNLIPSLGGGFIAWDVLLHQLAQKLLL